MAEPMVDINLPLSVRSLPSLAVLPASLPPEPTPFDWLAYLLARLEDRRPLLDLWTDYYEGRHPLAFFTQSFRHAFGERWRHFASNFAMLVVDGIAERLEVQGFRFEDEAGDQDLWDVWQANDLDGVSQQVHTEALTNGIAYVLVEPRRGEDTPRITVEDARDAIVHTDPRDRRKRLAGLKRWIDDDGHLAAIVYTLDSWSYYRTEKPIDPQWNAWRNGADLRKMLLPWATPDRAETIAAPLPVIPLIPFYNRPRTNGVGRSEIDPIMSNQDAINYYRAASIIAARSMATPQRYLLNFDIEIDPDTGRPRNPFVTDAGEPANLWTIANPDPNGPKPLWPPQAGQFEAADVTRFLRLIEGEVWQIASVSRLPYQELLQSNSSIPSSGESLKASEASLVRKVGRAQIHFGEGWEEVMRTALVAQQDARSTLRTAETLWVSPETRNEAVRTDSIVKLKAAGVIDDQTAMEMAGLTPAQIARQRARMEAAPPALPAGPPAVEMVPAPAGPRMSPVVPGT